MTSSPLQKAITTADVPPEFLKTAFLVGNIPFKALISDPRISYKMYVPPEHLNPDPGNRANTLPLLPLLVVIHGTARQASELLESLIPFANEKRCAVAAPLFPIGIDDMNDLDSYKVLKSKTLRSDLAVLSMLNEISHRWPGIFTSKIFLSGFSGGGQFAHRFLYLYPERLHAISIGAPGIVTPLDGTVDWPHGTRNAQEQFGRSVNVTEVAKVSSIQLVVGEDDVVVHGSEKFWKWFNELRKKEGKGIKEGAIESGKLGRQRIGRVETITRLQREWEERGIDARLNIVPGVAHDWRGVQNIVLEFLGPLVSGWKCESSL